MIPATPAPRPARLFGATLLLLLFLAAGPGPALAERDRYEVFLDGHRLEVELALTVAQKRRGLSGRTYLGPNKGMLFIYPRRRPLRFWMAGMTISLDILWLAGDRLVGVAKNVPPPGPGQAPKMVFSPVPVDRVLEVQAGWTDRHRVRPGAILKGPARY